MESLAKKGIEDTEVLAALEKVPRHFFMDSAFSGHAYQDKAFAIGEGQTISQPYTVAFQTQLLAIKKGDKVLEIGTGSGYQAAVLLEMGCELFTIERNQILHKRTKRLFRKLHYNCAMILGDGSEGHPPAAPYQKIIVTAAAPRLPAPLVAQLALGGIIVAPVGNEDAQKMIKLTKIADRKIRKEVCGDFSFVKLIGKNAWES